MRSARRRISHGSIAAHPPGSTGQIVRQAVLGLLIAAASVGMCWLVVIYGNGLRDPRYLDGWVLAGGMGLQLVFHIVRKTSRLSPKAMMLWRRIHIYLGYLLIVVFALHSDFSLPDTNFEWALWAGFVLVTLTGIFGTYLAWALRAMGRIDEGVGYHRIPDRRAELARDLQVLVEDADPYAPALDLPALPHDAWIADLYATRLRDFFEKRRNFVAHIVGSRRPVSRLTGEIDDLSRYVDQRAQSKLAAVRQLVIDKDRLDCACVYLGLTRAWLLVHVPVTYLLIVLTVLHVIVVYAFSSGAR